MKHNLNAFTSALLLMLVLLAALVVTAYGEELHYGPGQTMMFYEEDGLSISVTEGRTEEINGQNYYKLPFKISNQSDVDYGCVVYNYEMFDKWEESTRKGFAFAGKEVLSKSVIEDNALFLRQEEWPVVRSVQICFMGFETNYSSRDEYLAAGDTPLFTTNTYSFTIDLRDVGENTSEPDDAVETDGKLRYTVGKPLSLYDENGICITLNADQPDYEDFDYIRLGTTITNDTETPVNLRCTAVVNGFKLPNDGMFAAFDEVAPHSEGDGLIWIYLSDLIDPDDGGTADIYGFSDIDTLDLSFAFADAPDVEVGSATIVFDHESSNYTTGKALNQGETGIDVYWIPGSETLLYSRNGVSIYLMGDEPVWEPDWNEYLFQVGVFNDTDVMIGAITYTCDIQYDDGEFHNSISGFASYSVQPHSFSKDRFLGFGPKMMDDIPAVRLKFFAHNEDFSGSFAEIQNEENALFVTDDIIVHFDLGEREESFTEAAERKMRALEQHFVQGEDLTIFDENGIHIIMKGNQPELNKGTLFFVVQNNADRDVAMLDVGYSYDNAGKGGSYFNTIKSGNSFDVQIEVSTEDVEKLIDRQLIGVHFRGTDGYYDEMFNTGNITIHFDEGIAQAGTGEVIPSEADKPESEALQEDVAKPEGEASVQGPGEEHTDKETVRAVQAALNAAGFECGIPDGIAGKNTKRAIASYQAYNGLFETGTVTDELLRSLGLDISP